MIGYDLATGDEKLVRRRHAVRLLHVAGHGRRQSVLRRLVARRPGETRISRCRRSTSSAQRRLDADNDGDLSKEEARKDRVQRLLRQSTTRTRTADHARRVGRDAQVHRHVEEQRVRPEARRHAATSPSRTCCGRRRRACPTSRRRSSTAANTSWSRTAASSPPTTPQLATSCTRSGPSPRAATTPRPWPPTATFTSRRSTTAP